MGAGHGGVSDSWEIPNCAMGSQCACVPTGSVVHEDVPEPSPITRVQDDYIRNSSVDEYRDEDDSDGSSHSSRSSEVGERKEGPLVLVMRHRVFDPHMRFRFHDHYRIERLLGEGSYGNVYEAVALTPANGITHISASPTQAPVPLRRVAVKCFAPDSPALPAESHVMAQGGGGQEKDMAARRASFERERSILSALEHPHIVKLFECFEEQDRLWIVMELCRGGEVYECIADHVRRRAGRGLDESLGQTLFRQMLQAVTYLHSWQIVHRDIKTENFLLVGPLGSPSGELVKLCDFGTAVKLTTSEPRAMERIGTLSYAAPEIYAKLGATTLADIWSLGVVLYVMLVGASPFRITGDEPTKDTIDRIAHGRFDTSRVAWAQLSTQARDLICHVLVVDERRRLTGAAALRHPWLYGATAVLGKLPQAPVGALVAHGAALGPGIRREDRLARLAPHATGVLTLAGKFARLDLLQQLLLTLCVQMTPDVELPSFAALSLPWYELFCVLDKNEDGRLDFSEFVGGMRSMLVGPGAYTDDQLLSLARSLDMDRSGAIEWVEWMVLALLSVDALGASPEPLATAFRALDRPSSDGSLGVGDLLVVVGSVATSATSHAARGVEARNASVHHLRDVASRTLGRWCSANLHGALAPAVVATNLGRKSARAGSKRGITMEEPSPALGPADLCRALRAATDRAAHLVDERHRSRERDSAGSGDETSQTMATFGGRWFGCCETDRAQQAHIQHETVFQPNLTAFACDANSPL